MINIVDRMLGFGRTLEGFHLRPKLPTAWKEARYARPFRGATFEIHIRRGSKPGIKVDGKSIAGDLIPVPQGKSGNTIVHVECEL